MKVVLKLNQAGKYDYKSYDSIGNLRVFGQKIGTKDGSQFIGWINFYKNDSILQEEALVIGEELIVNQRKMYAKSELVRDSSTYFYYDNGSLNLNIEKKYVYPAPGLSFSKDITSDFSNLNNSGDTLAPNQINKEENYFSWDISLDSLKQMNGYFIVYYWEIINDENSDSLIIDEYHKNIYFRGNDL